MRKKDYEYLVVHAVYHKILTACDTHGLASQWILNNLAGKYGMCPDSRVLPYPVKIVRVRKEAIR